MAEERWHVAGGEIIRDTDGKRIAWCGYAKKAGCSQRVTYEERARYERMIAAAPVLVASINELAVALRDTLQGYPARELSDTPAHLFDRALAALEGILGPEDWQSLRTTLEEVLPSPVERVSAGLPVEEGANG